MNKITLMLTGREFAGASLLSICQGHPSNVVMELWGTVESKEVIPIEGVVSDLKEVVYVELTGEVVENQQTCRIYTEGHDGELGPIISEGPAPGVILSDLVKSSGGGVYYWVNRKGKLITFLSRTDGFPEEKEFSDGTVKSRLSNGEKVWFKQVVMDLRLIQEAIIATKPEVPVRAMKTLETIIEHNQAVLESDS